MGELAGFQTSAPTETRSHRVQVSMAHCRLFLRELRAHGVDCERQLSLLGINYAEGEDFERFLPASQFAAFLRLATEVSRDPWIGLHAGERIRTEDLDLLGLLIRSSPDVRSACDLFVQFRGAIQHVLDLEISALDGTIVCRRVMPGVPSSRTLSDYFLARTLTLLRQLLGPVEPLEVRTVQVEPLDSSEHQRVLGAQLRFGEREDALVLSEDILARPMVHRDAALAHVLTRYVARLPGVGSPSPMELSERVRSAIAEELRQGRATLYTVAAKLNLSERTLRRQLSELGMSFQGMLDDVRRDMAVQYLKQSQYSASVLSARLGFMGAGAFYRAFRRWTGVSVSEYRAEHGTSSLQAREL